MTASHIGYGKVLEWVKGYLIGMHSTVVVTVAWVVLCTLAAQRVTPAALARALPAEESGSARSRLRRVRRWWQGPQLDLDKVTPRLIGATLALLPVSHSLIVALDTTRLGPWEVWQAGVVFAGHTLPIAWAVVPYPWPKGRFRETTLLLIAQLQSLFPPDRHWILVADRGFPSAALFDLLQKQQTGWTVRLKISDWVEVDGIYRPVREHLLAGRVRSGQLVAAAIGRGSKEYPKTTAAVAVNDTLPLPPKHKRNPGTQREQAARAKAQAGHLAHKGRRYRPPSETAKRYAQTWVLFTTASLASVAMEQYAARMAIEQTFRDLHHTWGLREAAVSLVSEQHVHRMVSIVSLAYRLQVELGWRLSCDLLGRLRRSQWTVTDRVSLFWCGQHLFHDPGCDWSGWLAGQWEHLTRPDNTIPMSVAA
jgi:hypothetical protein